MTTKEKLIETLLKNGMSENQANEVMKLAMPELNKIVPGYLITFDSDWRDYPDLIYNAWYNNTVKPIAFKWIEENCPDAWYKEIFAN